MILDRKYSSISYSGGECFHQLLLLLSLQTYELKKVVEEQQVMTMAPNFNLYVW